jgi:hypothetical protein
MNCFYNAYDQVSQFIWAMTIYSIFLRKNVSPWDASSDNVQERFVNEMIDVITLSKNKASKFRAEVGQNLLNRIRKEMMPTLVMKMNGGFALPIVAIKNILV